MNEAALAQERGMLGLGNAQAARLIALMLPLGLLALHPKARWRTFCVVSRYFMVRARQVFEGVWKMFEKSGLCFQRFSGAGGAWTRASI